MSKSDEGGHSSSHPVNPHLSTHPWTMLRRHTAARIALGRIGASLPTSASLDFAMAHARARDAVHLSLDVNALTSSLIEQGFATQLVRSRAATREEYLRRPDLGRRLAPKCIETLATDANPQPSRLTIVIGDGLASLAAARHAEPLVSALRAQLFRAGTYSPDANWSLDTVFVATQARVALADEVGHIRGAEAVVILLGERPGLSAPDSLGAYLTYSPHIGRADAERNCISNIRPGGLSYEEAAYKLHYLLQRCRLAKVSGVSIRDSSDWRKDKSLL